MTEPRPPHCVPELVRPNEFTMNALQYETREAQIKFMKEWCLANYEGGASTMVECWEDEDFKNLFVEEEFEYGLNLRRVRPFDEAFDILFRVASVYGERESDANYYRRGEC